MSEELEELKKRFHQEEQEETLEAQNKIEARQRLIREAVMWWLNGKYQVVDDLYNLEPNQKALEECFFKEIRAKVFWNGKAEYIKTVATAPYFLMDWKLVEALENKAIKIIEALKPLEEIEIDKDFIINTLNTINEWAFNKFSLKEAEKHKKTVEAKNKKKLDQLLEIVDNEFIEFLANGVNLAYLDPNTTKRDGAKSYRIMHILPHAIEILREYQKILDKPMRRDARIANLEPINDERFRSVKRLMSDREIAKALHFFLLASKKELSKKISLALVKNFLGIELKSDATQYSFSQSTIEWIKDDRESLTEADQQDSNFIEYQKVVGEVDHIHTLTQSNFDQQRFRDYIYRPLNTHPKS